MECARLPRAASEMPSPRGGGAGKRGISSSSGRPSLALCTAPASLEIHRPTVSHVSAGPGVARAVRALPSAPCQALPKKARNASKFALAWCMYAADSTCVGGCEREPEIGGNDYLRLAVAARGPVDRRRRERTPPHGRRKKETGTRFNTARHGQAPAASNRTAGRSSR
ncbi:hypothetical protein PHYPSEUDO_013213 [Phytophthora pseudosyringae]|uniref:Uncharacterized protein n=1 Tax=Phytophthora pseudosyringae TaxID=221518 RepID=A0A8T1V8X4_9STRA|nr:hypothetical protein PHYPSEUDO_013213 [Phytophthora pseudosyringae]